MKRPMRQSDGLYHIHGKTFKMLIGSRQQVWNKTAFKTEGLLTRDQLIMNKWGRIVSKKKHATAKKEKRLLYSQRQIRFRQKNRQKQKITNLYTYFFIHFTSPTLRQ